jgi:hypothetical protein
MSPDYFTPIWSGNAELAVATKAGRPEADERTMAGRQQSTQLSREGHMMDDVALSAGRLRFSK